MLATPEAARPGARAARAADSFPVFVALIAALMMVNALTIDLMLPALPQIGEELGVARANDRQWIITAYMFGFGVAQLIYGPLSDRYGRRPVLMGGLALYVLTTLAAAYAFSFPHMIAMRVATGVAAAATRVLAVSIVRDRYQGRRMAQVQSFSGIIFMAVPIFAPSVGGWLLEVMPWRGLFWALGLFGAAVLAWVGLGLPETLDPAHRRALTPRAVGATVMEALRQRAFLFYSLLMACTFGGIIAYVTSSQQIIFDTFGAAERFGLIFGLTASAFILASLLNARFVPRLGTRRIAHGALFLLVGVAAVHVLWALSGLESLWSFVAFQAASFVCIGLVGSNANAISMSPVGHLAGTASSVQGFISTIGAALIGGLIGQAFDGTTVPIAAGYLLIGLAALGLALLAERGRLFGTGAAAEPARS